MNVSVECQAHSEDTYHDGTFPPTTIPMTGDVADPVALTPDTRTDRDFRIKLNTHLEIALEDGLGDWKRARSGGVAYKTAHDHGLVIALFRNLCWSLNGSAVDGFVEDGVVRVVLFHGAEVVGTFEEVGALTRCVFGAYRLAVDALRRETLLFA